MNKRTFYLLAAGITLIAFALREWHVLASVLPNPTQGDVASYLRYAMHMVWDGTFSQAGNGEPVVPDAYRSPGYPAFLALIFLATGLDGWYPAIYQAQAVIGALTVAGTIVLARQWLTSGWALAAGALLSLSPHHIAASNAMLVEVVFAFTIVVSLLLSALAIKRRSMRWAVAAGVACGAASLVNPVFTLFPFALLAVFARERAPRLGVVVLVAALALPGAWSLRNAAHGVDGGGRGWSNLVQGSWPDYHRSQVWWPWKPELLEVKNAISAEEALIAHDRGAALRSIAARITAEPGRFARWYAIEKPYLLWDWGVRMGKGGHYTLDVQDSPLDKPPLLWATIMAWALNPVLFALAVLGAGLAFRGPAPYRMTALFFCYVTLVHVGLQAEPRYAIAYRGVQMLMAAGALAWVMGLARRLSLRHPGSGDNRLNARSDAGRVIVIDDQRLQAHVTEQAGPGT